MTVAARYGAAAAAVLRRDAALYFSYRTRFAAEAFTLVFSVTLFYYVSRLVSVGSYSPERYFEFVLIGLVVLQTITATMALLPVMVRSELVAGTFERVVLSPFGAIGTALSMLVFPFLRALAAGLVMILAGVAAFGLRPEWPEALLALPVSVVAALAFTPFALLFTAAVLAFKQAPGTGLVLSLISLLAGMYFPVVLLPDWVQWTADVQPFTPAVDLLRHVLTGTGMDGSPWAALGRVAAFAAVTTPPALLTLRAALRLSQRRGTVTEF